MTKTRLSVDTGSVHLPAGEDNLSSDASREPREADTLSVAMFRQAFDERRPAMPEWPLDEEPIDSPFSLFGGAGTACHADPSEIGAALEHLWVSSGVSSVREVRMKLNESLLPGTAVRIHESGGCVQLDLSVTSEATRRWLTSALPLLVRDLGERLKQPVRATLLGRRSEGDVLSFDWPPAGAPA